MSLSRVNSVSIRGITNNTGLNDYSNGIISTTCLSDYSYDIISGAIKLRYNYFRDYDVKPYEIRVYDHVPLRLSTYFSSR